MKVDYAPAVTIPATNVALKEWAVVCDLLLNGQQVVLLRKGGIHEQRKGFAIEHDAFYLYPNTEHQSREQLQPAFHPLLERSGPPPQESGVVTVPGFCRVVDVIETTDPAALRALEAHTCWTQALFDMRLAYKPDRPNYVVTVRSYRLPRAIKLPYHKAYAGCRSWVPLRDTIPEAAAAAAEPVLDDAAFEQHRRTILGVVR
jgi:hypothetical protein